MGVSESIRTRPAAPLMQFRKSKISYQLVRGRTFGGQRDRRYRHFGQFVAHVISRLRARQASDVWRIPSQNVSISRRSLNPLTASKVARSPGVQDFSESHLAGVTTVAFLLLLFLRKPLSLPSQPRPVTMEPQLSEENGVRIAVEGCGHGTLHAIYASVERSCAVKGWPSVDLLIIGGDFQVCSCAESRCLASPLINR